MKNIIPTMTDPLSKAWEQPSKEKILIDDTHSIMSTETMNELKNYSHSIPSGVYEGKMWKAESKGVKFLRWYSSSDDPNKCNINTREIILLD